MRVRRSLLAIVGLTLFLLTPMSQLSGSCSDTCFDQYSCSYTGSICATDSDCTQSC